MPLLFCVMVTMPLLISSEPLPSSVIGDFTSVNEYKPSKASEDLIFLNSSFSSFSASAIAFTFSINFFSFSLFLIFFSIQAAIFDLPEVVSAQS